MYTPNHYPAYITGIKDINDKIEWQSNYLNAYEKEYRELNSQWNALKAVMFGVSLFALTLFASIMTAASTVNRSLAVALTLFVFSVGTAASICTAIYYGILSDQNHTNLQALPSLFPMKFEVYFNVKMLEKKMKKQDVETQEDTPI